MSVLDGYRVIDLTAYVAGPFASQQLADLGADVIKVEPPRGDETRLKGHSTSGELGPTFLNLNRNKRSIVLDLKSDAGRRHLIDLVTGADVFLHNLRLPAVERLHATYDELRAANDDLVYCQIVGFGSNGPYAGRPAFDDVIQGVSGFAATQGVFSGRPTYTAFPMMDYIAGLFAAQSVVAALLHRERTGRGQLVEVPMLEAGIAVTLPNNLWQRTHDPAGDLGYPRNLSPDRRPFATRDGWFCVVMSTDEHFTRFFRGVDRPDLADDARFVTNPGRATEATLLHQTLAEIFARRTTAEWSAIIDHLDLPGMPLNTMDELFDDPHLRAVDLFRTIDHPAEGQLTAIAPPIRYSDSPTSIRRHAPLLGEHTGEVLEELGATDEASSGQDGVARISETHRQEER
ncbi:MAG: CoA transferase [Actinomycetota bacterium]